jgi:hypothetical protein
MAVDIFSGAVTPRDWSLGSDSMGLTILWRTAKAQLESLKAAVDILNLDISAWYHQQDRDADQKQFTNAWNIWRDQFYQWYRSNVSTWDRMFSVEAPWSVASLVEQKQGELNTWRHQFETVSGKKSFGAPQPNQQNPGSPSTSLWKWIAIGGGGGLLALYGAKKFNDFRKAFSPL